MITNDDWAAKLDTSDEWITQRTGIKRRRFAAEDETTMTLAASAAKVAIKDAGLAVADIDEIMLPLIPPK